MYATRHLDWLSFTVDTPAEANRILHDPDWRFVGAGRHGYRSAYEAASTGARMETDSPIAGMDTHVTLSGVSLSQVRLSFENGDDGLVRALRDARARTSRVDLALNIHDGNLTVRDFYSAYMIGDLKTMARRVYHVEGISDERMGETLYLGSPKSDRQCRIYDKAAEQAIVDPKAWVRLELALRDLRAKSMVAATKDNSVSATVAAHLAEVLSWDQPEYLSSLGDDVAALHPIKRKKPAVEKWLLDQCAPALARVYNVRPDFMVEFMTSFRQSLDKLRARD